MGVTIKAHTVQADLRKLNDELRSVRDQIHDTKDKINAYLRDGSLSGSTYYAHKNYLSSGHLPFLDSFSRELDTFISANNTHIAAIDTHLMPYDLYNENMIESNLAEASRSIDKLNHFVYDLNMRDFAKPLSERRDFQKTWIERQARLANYITATNTIYNFTKTAMQRLERNLLRIEYARSCPTTGSFLLPSAREMYYIAFKRGVEPDTEMLFAAVLSEDGTVNWKILRRLDWDKASLCIQHIAGEDVFWLLVDEVRNAEWCFDRWNENELWDDVTYRRSDPMLLLEKLKDHLMMEEIRKIKEDPRFSLEAFIEATGKEREAILTAYLDEVFPVFGLTDKPNIEFDNSLGNASGKYHHGLYNALLINSLMVENFDADSSYDLFDTIVHEFRHVYQVCAVNRPREFIVSEPTLSFWHQNHADLEKKYISSGAKRADGSVYTWTEYRNQPTEIDAFGMGELTGWRWYEEGDD